MDFHSKDIIEENNSRDEANGKLFLCDHEWSKSVIEMHLTDLLWNIVERTQSAQVLVQEPFMNGEIGSILVSDIGKKVNESHMENEECF